jgi:deoxyribodipyrimidine photo-lyase
LFPALSKPHPLESEFVADQLRLRSVPANAAGVRTGGEFVLYWMQATQRLEDNWALRLATLEADRLGRPLLIYQGLDPTYEYASDRIHAFILEGARETAAHARAAGLPYVFTLRRRRDDDRRVVDRISARACLVVTDLLPTAGIAERTRRFAERARCLVTQVDSYTVVPSGCFTSEQYSAAVIRPKLNRLRDHYLQPIADHPPRHTLPPATLASLECEPLDVDTIDLPAVLASCEIDHSVGVAPLTPGRRAAQERLAAFTEDGLAHYEDRRREPADAEGSSRLSPYLHFGQIGAAEVARATIAARGRGADPYLDELITWRELAMNFCLRNRDYAKLRCLPRWAQETMAAHTSDPRDPVYSLRQLAAGHTHDSLWNAAQRQLTATGTMHNAVRTVWGKSILLWTTSYRSALRSLLVLNNRYGLDGRDPNSFLNILWCFGKFDRPFAERPVWGKIRPMSLDRARAKFDAARYVDTLRAD